MAAYASVLLSGMLLAFPKHPEIYDPPRPIPTPVRGIPGIGPDARDIGQLMRRVRTDISRGRHSGGLSHREAKELRRQAEAIDMLESRYARDGLTDAELKELQSRLEALRSLTYAKASPLTSK